MVAVHSALFSSVRIKFIILHILSVFTDRYLFNPLESRGNYSATLNNMKLVRWPLMGGLLHLVQRGGTWAGPQPTQTPPRCTKCNSPPIIWYSKEGSGWAGAPPRSLLVVPNVTAHPSTARLPITVLLYNGPLLCGFNVGIKGLIASATCVI